MTEKRSGQEKSCVFPFRYRGVVYNNCTDVDDAPVPWCSTKTNGDGQHIGGDGNWGECTKGCKKVTRRKQPKPQGNIT